MYLRYNTSTKQILHRGTTAFTVPCPDGEADCLMDDAIAMFEPLNYARLTTDLRSIGIDPALIPPLQYQRDRANAYPPIGDQLDDLFRQGAFSPEMAAQLKAVKTAHPKGTL